MTLRARSKKRGRSRRFNIIGLGMDKVILTPPHEPPGRARLRRALESLRREKYHGSTESRPTLANEFMGSKSTPHLLRRQEPRGHQ